MTTPAQHGYAPCPTCNVLTKTPHTIETCRALLRDAPGPDARPPLVKFTPDALPEAPLLKVTVEEEEELAPASFSPSTPVNGTEPH